MSCIFLNSGTLIVITALHAVCSQQKLKTKTAPTLGRKFSDGSCGLEKCKNLCNIRKCTIKFSYHYCGLEKLQGIKLTAQF